MLLPCPHCRRQFRLHRERICSERARIKCPACGGVFCISVTPPAHADDPSSAVTSLSSTINEQTADIEHRDAQAEPSPRIHPEAVKHPGQRRKPAFLMFWALVPACFLFAVVTGILLSGPWRNTSVPNDLSVRAGTGSEDSLSSSVSSQPAASRSRKGQGDEAGLEPPNLALQEEDPVAHAFWAPATSEAAHLCEVLPRPPNAQPATKDEDSCQLYPPWITYLVLENAQAPVCELEPAFVHAMSAIEHPTPCGPGYAFLTAYYLKMNVLERAHSFLEEALRLEPDDPWVRLVEAVFYERAQGENQKALNLLEKLHQEYPAFLVAGYLLAKTHIRQEDYRRANEIFQSRKEDIKGQVAFWRIRRALSSLENAPDHSVEKAEGLLAMSRAFATLKDYPMAEHLYRWVLEEIPGKLPKGERMAAYCELGRIYETRGEKSKAYDSYRSAIEIDPAFPDALEGIGHILPPQANPS